MCVYVHDDFDASPVSLTANYCTWLVHRQLLDRPTVHNNDMYLDYYTYCYKSDHPKLLKSNSFFVFVL